MTTRIDYSALFVPVTRAQLTEFRRRDSYGVGSHSIGTILVVVGMGLFGGMIALPPLLGWAARGAGGGPPIVAVVILLAAAAMITLTLRSSTTLRRRQLRCLDFAAANDLDYHSSLAAPQYPGMIFAQGRSRRTTGNYRRRAAPTLDIGNYQYVTGSGKHRTTHTWGYVAMRLPRRLPHMLLDARSNNLLGMSNLPSSFAGSQRLSLEGDFDKYFTLYCPAEYETDALYVFTPDLMALLIDGAARFDIEIVDDWMLLYSSAPLRLDDPATLRSVFSIVDTVGAKAARQTRRYADAKIGDRSVNLVAPAGRRLTRSRLTPALGVFAVVAAIWTFQLVLRMNGG